MNTTVGRRFATATGMLSVAMLAASGANYGLNLGLARLLTPADFGDATLVVTLLLGLTSIGVALQLIAARAVAGGEQPAVVRETLAGRSARGGALIAALATLTAPALQSFFQTGSPWPFVALAVGLPVYLVQSVDRGVLQGRLAFGRLSLSFVVEAAVRLLGGLGLVAAGFGVTGATIALSLSFVGSWLVVRPRHRSTSRARTEPTRSGPLAGATGATVLLLVGQVVINNGDVVWAKQILDPATAGAYAAIALVGRAVFFCSWAVANAAFPLATGDDDPRVLRLGIAVVTTMAALAIAGILVMGDRLAPLMFGTTLAVPTHLFAPYAVATAFFAVANLIATVDVARGRADTALTVVGGGILQTVLLLGFGSSPATLVNAQLVAMAALLVATTAIHRHGLGAVRRSDELAVALAVR